jgi:hypothetical protein
MWCAGAAACYARISGTSAAAPMVAGAAALIASMPGAPSGAALKALILKHVDKLSFLEGKVRRFQASHVGLAVVSAQVFLGGLQPRWHAACEALSAFAGKSVFRRELAVRSACVKLPVLVSRTGRCGHAFVRSQLGPGVIMAQMIPL